MFEVKGKTYTVKYNQKKFETIETLAKTSIVGEVSRNNGFLPYNLLKTLFAHALVDDQNEVVKVGKASDIFDKLVETNGLATTNGAIVEKLQEDLGFLFR